MRLVFSGVALAACVVLSGCGQSEEAAPAPAAPKKSMARPHSLYAGQEQIQQVDAATVELGPTPDSLLLKADGRTASAGYTAATFLPRINPAPPADGIYEVDVVAQKPTTPAAQVVTPIHIESGWGGYPAAHLKGVKFITKTNSITAMLTAK
jgi:hypothetical protein